MLKDKLEEAEILFSSQIDKQMHDWTEFALTKVMPKIKEVTKQKDYGYHGLTHTEQVILFGIDYALSEKINPLPVILACALHDCAREHDNNDKGKGLKGHAAQCEPIARDFLEKYDFGLSEQEKESIVQAITLHTDGKNTKEKIAACLWDADRTRLAWEQGYAMEENFSTKRGLKIAKLKPKKQKEYQEYQTNLLKAIDAPSYILMKDYMYPKIEHNRETINFDNAPCIGTDKNPLIMYHGTPFDIAHFKPVTSGWGRKFVDFTPNISYAVSRLNATKNLLSANDHHLISVEDSGMVSVASYRNALMEQYGISVTQKFDRLITHLKQSHLGSHTQLSEDKIKQIIASENDFVAPKEIKNTFLSSNTLENMIQNFKTYTQNKVPIPTHQEIISAANITKEDLKKLDLHYLPTETDAFNQTLIDKWQALKKHNIHNIEASAAFPVICSYFNALNTFASQHIIMDKFKDKPLRVSDSPSQAAQRVYKVELKGIFPKEKASSFYQQGIYLPMERICRFSDIDYPIQDDSTFLIQSVKAIRKMEKSGLSPYASKDNTKYTENMKKLEGFSEYIDRFRGSRIRWDTKMLQPYVELAQKTLQNTIGSIPITTLIDEKNHKQWDFTKLIDGLQKLGENKDTTKAPHYSVFNMDAITIKTRYTFNKERLVITKIERVNSQGYLAPEPEKQEPKQPVLTPELLARNIHRYL